MRRTAGAIMFLLLVPAGAATGVGITPARLDLGTHAPDDTFYGEFHVLATGNRTVSVDFSTGTASLSTFRRLDAGDPATFSAQPCRCITLLRGDGVIRERDRRIRNAARWNTARFLIDLPRDIEPGTHLLTVTPRPALSDGAGSVGMVSTTTLPVIVRVPGHVQRSGMLLGVRRGDRVGDTQELVARFYNNGTATMRVSTRFILDTRDGSRTVPAGTQRVAPDETVSFTAAAPQAVVNGSTVTAVADHGTGVARATAPFSARERPRRHPFDATSVALLLVLLLTTALTWQVVRRG